MINIDYRKRKNFELFKRFEEPTLLNLSKTQNYIPIYTRFFNLNETNYNNINLNNNWFLTNIDKSNEYNNNLFKCQIKNIDSNNIKEKEVFFKMAPLLDPYKYMIGKYNISNPNLLNLPKLKSTQEDCNEKILDINNSGYVDGLFLFLSSQLFNKYKFIHGIEYYGSFLAIKNEFKINVFDDIDYLNNSDFFNKNKNILFKINDYEHLFKKDNNNKLKPIKFGNNVSLNSLMSINNEIFENIFDENNVNLKDIQSDLIDITNSNINTEHHITLKTNSTCSSRSSHTNDDDDLNNNNDNEDGDEDEDEDSNEDNDDEYCDENKYCDENNEDEDANVNDDTEWVDEDEEDEEDEDEDNNEKEERIDVILPKFPVQVIAMEYCENTFDDLILNNNLTNEEWYSALMQIIMILITYQKIFNFTHNDLHTNNVMYNKTEKKYIYYFYKKKYYKVPTFGKLFKIIDFGRSIFKLDGKLFCSDSFKSCGDAATQYNIEPYFNEKKPRLEPNPSFDLCRLACSIFDYLINDYEEMKDLSKIKDPVKRLIFEWCLDDKGINMLYKNNGVERYPEFKLYKMIARCVHYHTPQAQLERPEFAAYEFKYNKNISQDILNSIIDIDNIPIHF